MSSVSTLADPRRRRTLIAAGASLVAPAITRAQPSPRLDRDPFTLGVASGYPHPLGMVLWTRLAPAPLTVGGGMPPAPLTVEISIAEDESMRRVVQRGTALARAEGAHAVHFEAEGLSPDRQYWYRFAAGGWQSSVGCTRTTPPENADPSTLRLRLAAASCQHYERGYFVAYRQMAADAPDLILHLGDYIYEGGAGDDVVRRVPGPVAVTLDDYRLRYAVYKTDPDLQRAHAACPWLVTWDDHEVENDYAGERSQNNDPPGRFLERRADAYRAYYEHMPLPRRMRPLGPHMHLYTECGYGRLARFFMLDGRQYRTPQACVAPGRGGGVSAAPDCAGLNDPERSFLGAQQREWLFGRLPARPGTRWNLLGQQTLMQPAAVEFQGRTWIHTDGWDGYPAERGALLARLADPRVANPVVLGGDVHAFYANALRLDDADAASAAVASEFVVGAITSPTPSAAYVRRVQATHPAVRHTHTAHRGYLRMEITHDRLTADIMGVANVRHADSPTTAIARLVVEAGRPGPEPSALP